MKILLVEDNEILAKGLIYSLEQKKYQVIHTLNVENTLKILKTEKIDWGEKIGNENTDLQGSPAGI